MKSRPEFRDGFFENLEDWIDFISGVGIFPLFQSISVALRPRSKCCYRIFITALHIHQSMLALGSATYFLRRNAKPRIARSPKVAGSGTTVHSVLPSVELYTSAMVFPAGALI